MDAKGWQGEGNQESLLNEYKVFFWCDESSFDTREVAAQHCACAKCYRIVHFKMVNCILNEFNLNLKNHTDILFLSHS